MNLSHILFFNWKCPYLAVVSRVTANWLQTKEPKALLCRILECSANKCSFGFIVSMNTEVEEAPLLATDLLLWGVRVKKITLDFMKDPLGSKVKDRMKP